MTTIDVPDIKSEHSESDEWPTLDREPADIAREEPETHSFDPTQGRKVGAEPYDDPTQGRKIGAEPFEDPTQGRKIGAEPYDDPTQGQKIGSDPYDDPTRGRYHWPSSRIRRV